MYVKQCVFAIYCVIWKQQNSLFIITSKYANNTTIYCLNHERLAFYIDDKLKHEKTMMHWATHLGPLDVSILPITCLSL